MPYYSIHAYLPEEVTNITKSLAIQGLETSHVTIMYGPYIPNDEEEILNPKLADNVLGGFVENFFQTYPEFEITRVSYFERPTINILKLDVESSQMTKMQCYLRNNTIHSYNKECEDTKGYDQSYVIPLDGWAHITLGFLKKDLDIQGYVKELSEKLQQSGIAGKKFRATEIALISAKRGIRIPLW